MGWSGGAMVLSYRSVPGRPTNLDNCRARAYCICTRCRCVCVCVGGGVWTLFLSYSFSLFFLPLSGRRPDIDRNNVSKGR